MCVYTDTCVKLDVISLCVGWVFTLSLIYLLKQLIGLLEQTRLFPLNKESITNCVCVFASVEASDLGRFLTQKQRLRLIQDHKCVHVLNRPSLWTQLPPDPRT